MKHFFLWLNVFSSAICLASVVAALVLTAHGRQESRNFVKINEVQLSFTTDENYPWPAIEISGDEESALEFVILYYNIDWNGNGWVKNPHTLLFLTAGKHDLANGNSMYRILYVNMRSLIKTINCYPDQDIRLRKIQAGKKKERFNERGF